MHPPCSEEAYGCSAFLDDERSFGLEVLPEERTTTKPELRGTSNTGPHGGSTAATSVRSSVGPVANHHTRPPPPQQIKLKVTTVSLTPRHPKVVSLLKIPFPLPDIEVTCANVRKHVVTPVGIARPADAHSSAVGNRMGA